MLNSAHKKEQKQKNGDKHGRKSIVKINEQCCKKENNEKPKK